MDNKKDKICTLAKYLTQLSDDEPETDCMVIYINGNNRIETFRFC